MHAEEVGPEGVAFLSGRRRNGGPLTREAFESDLRREGFEVVHGRQKPGYASEPHAFDFDARIIVLGGEICRRLTLPPSDTTPACEVVLGWRRAAFACNRQRLSGFMQLVSN
jgi:hypothetical protein